MDKHLRSHFKRLFIRQEMVNTTTVVAAVVEREQVTRRLLEDSPFVLWVISWDEHRLIYLVPCTVATSEKQAVLERAIGDHDWFRLFIEWGRYNVSDCHYFGMTGTCVMLGEIERLRREQDILQRMYMMRLDKQPNLDCAVVSLEVYL